MHLQPYISSINHRYRDGISREHSYRGDLQQLLERLTDEWLVTNRDATIAHHLAMRHLPRWTCIMALAQP